MLYYTNIIYKDKNLINYVEAFRSSKGIKMLDTYDLNENEKNMEY